MQKIKKFWNENKIKASIICAVCSFAIIGSVVAGTVLSTTYSQKSTNYPKLEETAIPGELKFDKKGQIIIPTIVDPENPSGIYENKLPEINKQAIPPEVLDSQFNKTKLNDILDDNKKKLFESLEGDLQQEVNVDNKLKMYVDNIIPNNNIELGKDISVENLLNSLYKTSTNNAKQQILTTKEISNLLALNNINYAKEYNATFTSEILTPSIYGGGGVKPPKPPHVDTDFPDNGTVTDFLRACNQDNDIRYGFAITYTVLLPMLTVASGIAAFFTFGISLLAAIADITFCGIEIANAWNEYNAGKAISYNLADVVKEYGNDLFKDWVKKNLSNSPLMKQLRKNILFETQKFSGLISDNYKVICSLVTIFSIAVKVTMATLEKILLKFL